MVNRMETSEAPRDTSWIRRVLTGAVTGTLAGLAVFVRDFVYFSTVQDLRAPVQTILTTGPPLLRSVAIGVILGSALGPGIVALGQVVSRRRHISVSRLALVLVAVAATGARIILVHDGLHLWLDVGILTCVLLAWNPHRKTETPPAIGWTISAGTGLIVATAVFFTGYSLANDLRLLIQIPTCAAVGLLAVAAFSRTHRLLDGRLRGLTPRGSAGSTAAVFMAVVIVPALLLSTAEAWHRHGAFDRELTQFATHGEATDSECPNVILISIDTLRADHVGFLDGEAQTPAMDAIAAESYVFERAYSVAPWTRPSFAAVFGGRYPHEMGIARTRTNDAAALRAFPFRWREDRPVLAEVLRDEGYATAAVVTNVNLCREAATDRGFDFFYNTRCSTGVPVDMAKIIEEALGADPLPGDERERASVVTSLGGRVMQCGDRPFLLWLHYMDPHHPYDSPDAPSDEHVRAGLHSAMRGDSVRTGAIRQRYMDAYRAEVEFADRWLRRAVRALRDNGLWDSSVVVFWSDHGEEFWDHGHFYHGQTLHQELIHVPLLIHLPGQSERHRVSQRVSLLDIMPTLMAVCDVPNPPEQLRGRSLSPVLRPDAADLGPFRLYLEGCSRGGIRKGLIVDRHKLIYDVYQDRFSLYDLERDPGELHDIWGTEMAPNTREWEDDLREWTEASLAEMDNLTGGCADDVPPEALRRLRDMGYVQ